MINLAGLPSGNVDQLPGNLPVDLRSEKDNRRSNILRCDELARQHMLLDLPIGWH